MAIRLVTAPSAHGIVSYSGVRKITPRAILPIVISHWSPMSQPLVRDASLLLVPPDNTRLPGLLGVMVSTVGLKDVTAWQQAHWRKYSLTCLQIVHCDHAGLASGLI